MGLWLNQHGTPAEAAACYRRTIDLDPNFWFGHYALGTTLRKLKQYDAAAASFRRAIETYPRGAGNGHYGLGAVFLDDLKKPAEALPHLREAIRGSTKHPNIYEYLARALEQTGQLKEAMEARREGVRQNATEARYPNAHEYLARALEKDGQIDEALEVRRDAVRRNPTAGAIRAVAMMLGAAGQWEQAAAQYELAVKLDPADAHGRYMAAVAHVGAGRLDDYRRVCREMVARYADTDKPLDAERTVTACLLLPDKLDAGDLEQVQNLAERAVSGGAKNPNFRFGARAKGLADFRAGLHAEAVRRLKQYAPDGNGLHQDVIAYAVHAMAQFRLGKIEEARAALSQAQVILKTKRPDPKKDRPFEPGQSHGWLYSEILCREAEALVLKKD
jgi:tetratricopeptide (TPR) repeat protein